MRYGYERPMKCDRGEEKRREEKRMRFENNNKQFPILKRMRLFEIDRR
jgi:hypothetical protein